MASVETRQNFNCKTYRIRLSDGEHPDRPRIGLGKVSKKDASLHADSLRIWYVIAILEKNSGLLHRIGSARLGLHCRSGSKLLVSLIYNRRKTALPLQAGSIVSLKAVLM